MVFAGDCEANFASEKILALTRAKARSRMIMFESDYSRITRESVALIQSINLISSLVLSSLTLVMRVPLSKASFSEFRVFGVSSLISTLQGIVVETLSVEVGAIERLIVLDLDSEVRESVIR